MTEPELTGEMVRRVADALRPHFDNPTVLDLALCRLDLSVVLRVLESEREAKPRSQPRKK